MRTTKLLLPLAIVALALPASASAAFQHVVASGESLSSVAAADGLSVDQLAAANGLSSDAQLVAGSLLTIPPQSAAAAAAGAAPAATAAVAATPAPEESTAAPAGGYVVQPGDTLSGIAAHYGVSVASLAAVNGLDPNGLLLSGATLSVNGAPVSTVPTAVVQTVSQPASNTAASTSGAQPTAEMVSASTVGAIAAANGVSPSLAEAIGYQESGFNNGMVSNTGATGVMQIEPGTWNYIGTNLATPPPLSPTSATDNIRGGVLLLRSLLAQTGGDPAMAAASYYQGLASVRQHGLYADTQQYVADVMALRQRFGGG
jgi:N-acetylmuramoyl-L-alanine amidase